MTPNCSRRDVLGAVTVAGLAGALAGCNRPDRGPGDGPGGGRGGGGPGDGQGPGGPGGGPRGPGDGPRSPRGGPRSPGDGTAAGSPGGSPAGTRVVAGPGGRFVFDPEEVRVSVGDPVTWTFASAGHNVSCYPDHSDEVSLPAGAEPFGSTPPDEPFATVPAGGTYSYAFETPGTYRYVCVPHVAQGMIARVVVEG